MPREALELVSKQEWEKIYVSMNFANVLGVNKTISSIRSITSEKRGGGESDLVIESEAISSNGREVDFLVGGGTKFYTYRIEIRVYTGVEQIEGDGLLEVID